MGLSLSKKTDINTYCRYPVRKVRIWPTLRKCIWCRRLIRTVVSIYDTSLAVLGPLDVRFVDLFYDFWIQKSHHFYDFWIQNFFRPFLQFLDPETAVFLRFLDPESAPFLRFLDPEFFFSISTISGSRNCSIFAVSGSRNCTISTISGSRIFLVHIHNFWIQKLQYF